MRYVAIFTSFILFISTTLFAGIINVPGSQPTIQAGINTASPGDTVLVDIGTYYENINFKGKAITVASNFIMDGDTNHISNTIIDGSQPANPDSGSVVYVVTGEDSSSIICGFTITSGTGTRTYLTGPQQWRRVGGGIFIRESGCSIMNNKIINNSIVDGINGGMGGGIFQWAEQVNSLCLIIKKNHIVSIIKK